MSISPIQNIRLILDDRMPVKLRAADTFARAHSEMNMKGVSGGEPDHRYIGWTTKSVPVNDPNRHSSSLVPGSHALGVAITSVGRSTNKTGLGACIGINESMFPLFPADGITDLSIASGHIANSVDHPVPMDRWFVSTDNHQPNAPLVLKFNLPPAVCGNDGCFMQVYHSGPWGCKNGVSGSGRFCLQLILDGSAILYELKDDGSAWFEQSRFRWNAKNPTGGEYTLIIRPHVAYTDTTWYGNIIEYLGGSSSSSSALGAVIVSAAIWSIDPNGTGAGVPVNVCDGTLVSGTVVPAKLMIEVRRDISANVHISQEVQQSGVMDDQEFVLDNGDIDATEDYPIDVYVYGIVPSGSALGIDLVAWDEGTSAWVVCDTITSSTHTYYNGTSKQCKLNAGSTRYKLRYSLTANAFGHAPTVTRSGVWRKGRYRMTETTPITIEQSHAVKITDIVIECTEDSSDEVARIMMVEDGRYSNPLDLRRNIPIRIEADVLDPRDMATVLTCNLFVGRIVQAPSRPTSMKLHDEMDYGFERTLFCVSECTRLSRQFTQAGFSPINMKATDALKVIIGDLGMPSDGVDSIFDIPDWEMIICKMDNSNLNYIEFNSDVVGHFRSIIEDWLMAMWTYDPSAIPSGASESVHKWGMIRVKPRPEGTEDAVAHLVGLVPGFGASGQKTCDNWKSFVNWSESSSTRIPYLFVEDEGYQEDAVSPELNELKVTSTGFAGVGSLGVVSQENMMLPAIVRNYRSTIFYEGQPIEPDPTSVDWLDEVVSVYECNPGYSSQQIVDNVAKARMRKAGQGYYIKRCQTPFWPVWDRSDPRQARPKRLQFGDVVDFQLRSETPSKYVVSKATTHISEDDGGYWMGRYYLNLESPRPSREWIVDRS